MKKRIDFLSPNRQIEAKLVAYSPLRDGGGLALVILGLARGDSRVGGMGAVLGLEIQSSLPWKDELDILGMEGERVALLRLVPDDFGKEK